MGQKYLFFCDPWVLPWSQKILFCLAWELFTLQLFAIWTSAGHWGKNTYGKSTQSAWGNMNLKLCVIWPSVMLQPTSVPSATVHKNKKWEMNKGHRKRATNWNITNLLWINKCHTVWCNTVFIMWLNTHHNRFIILLILNVDFSSTLQYQIYICSRCSW